MLITLAVVAALVAVNFVPMMSLRTPGMEEYLSHGMSVWATPEDAAQVEVIASRIVASRSRISQALGTDAPDEVGVIIYPSQNALKRHTAGFAGMLLPDWFIGRNTREHVLITSPAFPGPAHTRETVVQAAVHEYVHVFTDQRNRDLNYWLKEGIALYLAEQVPSIEAIRAERDLTYREFSSPNAIQFANVGGYTLAYTLIAYLDDTYGWDQVIALIAPGASYESILGKDDRALFDEWMSHLATL